MDAREQIAAVLERYAGFDRFYEEDDPDLGTLPTLSGATDRIIAIVREALTSPEVVSIAAEEIGGIENQFGEGAARDGARRGLNSALDTAFGAEPPRQEEER